ncbi:PKD domain-containing protein, partial [Candidatus Parcubacteria bacterium]|nr:PKD domain-containing protein [Candidatus Parcubacteria bacterium]
ARYLWNFGDGAISEGQNVKHVYKYPGEYIVILDISSGKYSASGRLTAKIIPNQLEIIEANQNYIKLHNGSNVELDISHWFLKAENIFFKFPANTFIKTNRDLMIDSSVSGLKAESQKAEILYPNGSIAFSFFGYAIAKPVSVVNFEPEEIVNVGNRVSDISGAVAGVESSASNTDSQVANVVSVVKGNDGDIKNWLLAILGIGAISGAGLILVRRQGLL